MDGCRNTLMSPKRKTRANATKVAKNAIPRAPPHPTLKMALNTSKTPKKPTTRLKVDRRGDVIVTNRKKTINATKVATMAFPIEAEAEKSLAPTQTGIEATNHETKRAKRASMTTKITESNVVVVSGC